MPFDTIQQGITALQQSMNQECQAEENFFYLPLLGKRFATSEASMEDLETSIRGFTAYTNPKRVCALFGDSGSGKSVFLKQFTLKLIHEYALGKPIPLFIALPLLTDPIHNAIEERLTKIGFNEAQLAELKTNYSFIFILDGYDEIHQLQNLYASNRLSEWNVKTIISCRSQYFYNKENTNLYFTPIENEREQLHLLQTVYVAPFNQDQVKHYFTAMQSQGKVVASYEEAIAIPGLQELMTTPFLLKLAIEALPEILVRYASTENTEDRHQLTQTDSYKNFIRRWFERQEQKLIDGGRITADMPDQKPIFWRYCQSLALEMHKHNLSWLSAEDERFSVYFKNDAETERLRSACPIKKTEDKIGFWHESLGMHFVAQTIYQESLHEKGVPVQELSTIKTHEEAQFIEQERPQGTIHLRLITDDPTALQNLADEVNRDPKYKAWLFDVIERSKTNEYYAVGAANAISVLNAARCSFSGLDLSDIRIPDANLDNALLDGVFLKNANLQRVSLRNAWLSRANLQEVQLMGVQFGEFPRIEHNKNEKIRLVITCMVFSTDEQWLILGAHEGNNQEVYIWDIFTNQYVRSFHRNFGRFSHIWGLSYSPDGLQIACGITDGKTWIWDLSTDTKKDLYGDDSRCEQISCSFDGKKIVCGRSLKKIRIWDIESCRYNDIDVGFQENYESYIAQFSPDKTLLAIGKFDGSLFIWRTSNWISCLTVSKAHPAYINNIVFSWDNKLCASANGRVVGQHNKCLIQLWDLITTAVIKTLEGHTETINCLAFTRNAPNSLLASGGEDCTVRLWDTTTGVCLNIFNGHTGRIQCLLFSPNDQRLFSGGTDGGICQWDVSPRQYYRVASQHTQPVSSVAFSSNDQQFISGSYDGTIRVWDKVTGVSYRILMGHSQSVRSVKFFNNNQFVLSGSSDQTVKLWNIHTGLCEATYSMPSWIASVALSPDNQWIASASGGGTSEVRLWNMNSQELVHILVPPSSAWDLTFSSDNKWLAAGCGPSSLVERHVSRTTRVQLFHPESGKITYGREIKASNCAMIWEIGTKKIIKKFEEHERAVTSVIFSFDNKDLISGSRDGVIRIWEIKTGKSRILNGHTSSVTSLAFNIHQLISGSQDGTIRLWNTKTNVCVTILNNTHAIHSIAANSQGELLVGCADHSVKLWIFEEKRISCNQTPWVMRWSSFPINLQLNACQVRDAIGISSDNQQLFSQKGAINLIAIYSNFLKFKINQFDKDRGMKILFHDPIKNLRKFVQALPTFPYEYTLNKEELFTLGNQLLFMQSTDKNIVEIIEQFIIPLDILRFCYSFPQVQGNVSKCVEIFEKLLSCSKRQYHKINELIKINLVNDDILQQIVTICERNELTQSQDDNSSVISAFMQKSIFRQSPAPGNITSKTSIHEEKNVQVATLAPKNNSCVMS